MTKYAGLLIGLILSIGVANGAELWPDGGYFCFSHRELQESHVAVRSKDVVWLEDFFNRKVCYGDLKKGYKFVWLDKEYLSLKFNGKREGYAAKIRLFTGNGQSAIVYVNHDTIVYLQEQQGLIAGSGVFKK